MLKLFGRTGKNAAKGASGKRDEKRYAAERELAHTGDIAARTKLAKKSDTHPEILYYLAQDQDPGVRRAVATNMATPAHVSPVLAKDEDVDVKMLLAERLVSLLPDISEDQQSQLYAFTVQALGTLAHDEVLKVRRALSTALKDHAYAPPEVVGQLARDIEREVSEPILKFCARLSDEDLLDILGQHPEPWVVSAIARRDTVSEPVVDAVIECDNEEATTDLIKNDGARFSEAALNKMIERARHMPAWHKPLAMRQELSFSMAQHLAEFVDGSVKKLLKKRKEFDAETKAEVSETVRRRLDFADKNPDSEPPETRVKRMFKEGALNDEAISDALAWDDHEFVKLALSALADVPPLLVDKMVATNAAKPIVSLAWRAGVSMRTAVELQQQLAKVQPRDLMYAKDGTDYPIPPEDMVWQLEFFGIEHRI